VGDGALAWPDTPLSFHFIAYGAIFLYLLTLAGDPEQPALGWYLVAFGLACLSSLAAFAWSRRLLWRDRRGVPPLYLFLSDATRPR
jgi:hypothetical protein